MFCIFLPDSAKKEWNWLNYFSCLSFHFSRTCFVKKPIVVWNRDMSCCPVQWHVDEKGWFHYLSFLHWHHCMFGLIHGVLAFCSSSVLTWKPQICFSRSKRAFTSCIQNWLNGMVEHVNDAAQRVPLVCLINDASLDDARARARVHCAIPL